MCGRHEGLRKAKLLSNPPYDPLLLYWLEIPNRVDDRAHSLKIICFRICHLIEPKALYNRLTSSFSCFRGFDQGAEASN
jgi:hypothetical protein